MSKVVVRAEPLHRLLNAVNGPAHYIRELQALRGPLFAESDIIGKVSNDFETLENHLPAFDPAIFTEMRYAMSEFVMRVDNGEVRSAKTYAKFKDILARLEATEFFKDNLSRPEDSNG